MTDALDDAEARQRILTDLDRTFFVEAGAGTGKTTVSVGRSVNLVAADRVRIDQLVAITFTEAAAAELRDRIREALERAAVDPQRPSSEQACCQRAVADIDLASISTIHAFAGQVLRTFPLEAGLPPGFATLDEIQQAVDFDARFNAWFWEDALQEPLRSVLKRALLLGMTRETLHRLAALFEEQYDLLTADTTWEAAEPPSALTVAAFVGRRLMQLERSLPYALDGERDPLIQIVRSAQSGARQILAARTEDDALAALFGLGRLRPEAVDPTRWRAALDGRNAGVVVLEALQDVNDRVSTTLGAHRSATLCRLLGYVRDFALAGARARRAAGVASFHDLLARTRDLLRDNAAVRHAAQIRYQRIFIDEFQDTDPLQAEIAFYLAADERGGRPLPADWRDVSLVPGKLFLVGDPKQSIYRFRGADIAVYDALLQRLSEARERLTHNFRSVEPVLDWVNHHFAAHMQVDKGFQAEYVPVAAQWLAQDGDPRGVRRIGSLLDGHAAEAAEAEMQSLATLARSAIEDGWLVSDHDTDEGRVLRPATYRDVCILLPARTHLRRLERALERTGVPYRVEAGKLVLATQEVRDLLACLRAIEDPSDQVALVAALRSPAYACSDVDLLRWVEGDGRLDHEDPGDGPDGPVKDALANLAEFHRSRLLVSAAALIERFIADRLLVASTFGEARPREAWRRLRYVVSRARAFTSAGRHTLRAFLDWIEGLQQADVRDPEPGSAESDEDAVHIQTIHGAKGLEYPIVLLGGLGSSGRGRFNSIELIANRDTGRLAVRAGAGWQTDDFADAQRRELRMAEAEAVRLLYVAATRAKDHLVLSLFRGARAEDSRAAIIERRLADASPELCPVLTVAEFHEREPEVPIEPVPAEWADEADSERSWVTGRQFRIETAKAPVADPGWWTPDERVPAQLRLVPPDGVAFRRDVLLLAHVEGVLLEERVDLAYRAADGYVLVLDGPDGVEQRQLRAGKAALAFAAATHQQVSAVNILQADGSTSAEDLAPAVARARAELQPRSSCI